MSPGNQTASIFFIHFFSSPSKIYRYPWSRNRYILYIDVSIREKRREKKIRTEKVKLSQIQNDFLFWNQPKRCVFDLTVSTAQTQKKTERLVSFSVQFTCYNAYENEKERRKRFESNTTILLTLWNEHNKIRKFCLFHRFVCVEWVRREKKEFIV